MLLILLQFVGIIGVDSHYLSTISYGFLMLFLKKINTLIY